MTTKSVLEHWSCCTARSAFIAGVWVPVLDSFDDISPSSEEILTQVANCGPDVVDMAVNSAKQTLEGPEWGYAATAVQKITFLHSLAQIMEKNKQNLALLDSLDEGKPLRESSADISDAISLCSHLIELLRDLQEHQSTSIDNGTAEFTTYVLREPVGVVAAITPWNYPFLMGAQKVLPALAAGCAVVLKPSELAPLSCLVLAQLCAEAGLSRGALNVVPGLGSLTGDALSRHPGVDKVSFTGSMPTARKVMAAASLGPRAVSLELGGKSALLVFEDADLPGAVDWIITGFVWNAGQVCSSTSRVLVHASIKTKLIDLLCEALRHIVMGDSLSDSFRETAGPTLGPVVSQPQYLKIWDCIDSAKAEGIDCVFGGTKDLVGLPSKGYFVPPTVFVDPPTSSRIWTEEIFGPVLCIRDFLDEVEAVREANASVYGLAGACFSADEARCRRVASSLRVGVVWVNCSQTAFVQAPWGGCKGSGFGRELGRWGLEECQQVKQVTGCAAGYSWGLWT